MLHMNSQAVEKAVDNSRSIDRLALRDSIVIRAMCRILDGRAADTWTDSTLDPTYRKQHLSDHTCAEHAPSHLVHALRPVRMPDQVIHT
jgi:hypothetical protein